MTTVQRKPHALAALSAALLLAACSPTRPPLAELDAASRGLGAARTAGAPDYAPAEYRAAGQHYDQAQAAEAAKDYEAAAQLARDSAADSELAVARARAARAREAVGKLRQDNANMDRDLTEHAAPEEQP